MISAEVSQSIKMIIRILIIILGALFIVSGFFDALAVLLTMIYSDYNQKFGFGIGLISIGICLAIMVAGIFMVRSKELPKDVPLHVLFFRLLIKLAGWYVCYLGALLLICFVLVLPKIGPAILALVMGSGLIWAGRSILRIPRKIWPKYEHAA